MSLLLTQVGLEVFEGCDLPHVSIVHSLVMQGLQISSIGANPTNPGLGMHQKYIL